MTEKLKISKGETDVKREEGTLLYSPNMVDLGNAEIAKEGEGKWDQFQVIGSSDAGESSYRSSSEETEADRVLTERLRNRAIGRKIRMLKLDMAA